MGYLFDGVWKGMVWYVYIYIYTYIHIYIVVAHKGSQAPELTKEGKLGPQVLPSFTKRQAAGAMFSNG